MRTQPEFRRIGLANNDGATRTHALDLDTIRACHAIPVGQGTFCPRQATNRIQVFYRDGKTMHPSTRAATGHFGIGLSRLRLQLFPRAQGHDGIHAGIAAFDAIQESRHDFPARHLARSDGPREFRGVQRKEVRRHGQDEDMRSRQLNRRLLAHESRFMENGSPLLTQSAQASSKTKERACAQGSSTFRASKSSARVRPRLTAATGSPAWAPARTYR